MRRLIALISCMLVGCGTSPNDAGPTAIRGPCLEVSFMQAQFDAIGEAILDDAGEPVVLEVHPPEPCNDEACPLDYGPECIP
jgi:hypothetical protein